MHSTNFLYIQTDIPTPSLTFYCSTSTSSCRRAVIDKVMDGIVLEGRRKDEDEKECVVCEKVRVQAGEAQRAFEEIARGEMEITKKVRQIKAWTQSIVQQGAMGEIANYETLQHHVRQRNGPYCTDCQLRTEGELTEDTKADECPLDTAVAAENIEAIRTERFSKRRLQR